MEKSKARRTFERRTRSFTSTAGSIYSARHQRNHRQNRRDVTYSSLGKTKKAQGAFTDAVNDVVQQHIPRSQWRTSFCRAAVTVTSTGGLLYLGHSKKVGTQRRALLRHHQRSHHLRIRFVVTRLETLLLKEKHPGEIPRSVWRPVAPTILAKVPGALVVGYRSSQMVANSPCTWNPRSQDVGKSPLSNARVFERYF